MPFFHSSSGKHPCDIYYEVKGEQPKNGYALEPFDYSLRMYAFHCYLVSDYKASIMEGGFGYIAAGAL